MKKSLFAIAAVTAFAGAAQAQSSVTVYGILDMGYVGGNERVSGVNTPFANGTNGVSKQNQNGFGQSAQSTSRLGFRGREDLGGGTAAIFTVELQLNPDSATVLGGTRTAIIGLSQKGIGQGTIGTQNTVVTDAMSPTITGQFNNIVGSLLFPGATTNTGAATNSTQFGSANSADGVTNAFTFRTTNTLKFQSERMAGFQVNAMAVLNDETDTQRTLTAANTPTGSTTTTVTGGKNNQNGWGLGASYQYKKFMLTAAYQSLRANNPYIAVTSNTTGNTVVNNTAIFGGVATGTNVNDNQAYVGATYDFGILKAYAGWIDRKVTSTVAGNNYAKRTAQEIGVRGNWTPKIESWASVGNGRASAFGVGEPTANIVGWQIGSNYILSKRTNLYAIYGQNGTSNVSTGVTGVNRSYNSNNYALGVRHTF